MSPSKVLFFVFEGRERPWNPLKGFEAPPGPLFEVRCFPGHRAAFGASMQDAVARLQRMLDREMGAHEKGAQGWYEAAFAELSHDERDFVSERALEVVRELVDSMVFEVGSAPGRAVLKEQVCAAC